jgi:hypothetical protein
MLILKLNLDLGQQNTLYFGHAHVLNSKEGASKERPMTMHYTCVAVGATEGRERLGLTASIRGLPHFETVTRDDVVGSGPRVFGISGPSGTLAGGGEAS